MDQRLRERRLLDRATFGPRPGDLDALREEGAEAWVQRQLLRTAPPDAGLGERLARFPVLEESSWERLVGAEIPTMEMRGRPDREARRQMARRAREISLEVVGSRVVRAVHGRSGLREVMLDFWSNHFSVYGRKNLVGALLPHYERDVLRPHVLGRFEDLLLAVARSPAMLVYLDNWMSTAPHLSRRVRRRARVRGRGGINENYARELLELHTLGVNGGYDQQDVGEVARVFTGWTLESRNDPVFRFREVLHDPGRKEVLGRRVRGAGIEQGESLLRRLARHPATAHHVSKKLAARFVADEPPPGLVRRVAHRFLETEGELSAVLAMLLLSPEFADPRQRKLRTPLRLFAAALRATDGATDGSRRGVRAIGRLGELPYFSRTPAGFPEAAQHWIDPGSLLERMNLAFALAGGRLRGTRLGSSFPETVTKLPETPARFAEVQALAIASPEFQWV
ncbi:MAG: DUF1800 domain-containing protein [Myxococcota bacterium]|jgi:uncharacterized protein (DUF1800 family)|nr:hypothetical protein [Deltaproteobacteria bacterium]MCP4241882.1 DUF1800 domain-containing protein [bacterium]MDP6074543.1 DUF1800 domain-containing protein [Myxococcota bacterium]MDP7076114.1 DUF1800 domain-containing protein [Myxococcota bacterium]MDP7301059.1 DUF1800 domain-containing protein [Myxococcota bacterium]